jgi:hypothetical protein
MHLYTGTFPQLVPASFAVGLQPFHLSDSGAYACTGTIVVRFCLHVAETRILFRLVSRLFSFGQIMSFRYTESYFNQAIEVAGDVKLLSFGAVYFIPGYYKPRSCR